MKGIEWFDEINIYLYTCTSQTNIVQKLFLTVKREKTLKSMQKIDMLQCTRLKYPE